MKKFILSIALLSSISLASLAQTSKELPEAVGVEAPAKLTDAQKEKVKAIHQDHKVKSEALKAEKEAKLKEVLTPEQFEKMKQREGKKHHGNKSKKKALSPEVTAKLEALKTTYEAEKSAIQMSRIAPDAQKQKLADLDAKFKTERRAIIKESKPVKK